MQYDLILGYWDKNLSSLHETPIRTKMFSSWLASTLHDKTGKFQPYILPYLTQKKLVWKALQRTEYTLLVEIKNHIELELDKYLYDIFS